jgi:GT2 family glycosyltransferase
MQVGKLRIAALLTCHNRQSQTLSCLDRLLSQSSANASIEVFLVDDGSTDGTSAAVAMRYPSVHLIQGNGSLYWTGGMRVAMEAANAESFDFFLWLNDDTRLHPDAIERLLQTHSELQSTQNTPIIVIGSICDPESGELTYGGSIRTSRWHPLRFGKIAPTSEPQRCDVFNGNCVLLPRTVVDLIGNLHPKLVHAAGDYEYGLRAKRKGVSSWIAADYIGECQTNSLRGTWMDLTIPLWQRYKKLFSVKGQPPVPRLIYYYNYGGPFWFALYPLVYFRPLVASMKNIFLS